MLVKHSGPDSALVRAVMGGDRHEIALRQHELELLRMAEFSMRWLVWAKSRDAQHGRNAPEPYRFPWEPEPDRGGWHGDVMTVDEADDFLGWDQLKAG